MLLGYIIYPDEPRLDEAGRQIHLSSITLKSGLEWFISLASSFEYAKVGDDVFEVLKSLAFSSRIIL